MTWQQRTHKAAPLVRPPSANAFMKKAFPYMYTSTCSEAPWPKYASFLSTAAVFYARLSGKVTAAGPIKQCVGGAAVLVFRLVSHSRKAVFTKRLPE